MLPLTALISGEKKHLNQVNFDSGENNFILSDKDDDEIKLYIDYILDIDNEYKTSDFSIFLFKHDSIAENNIFEVYEKELNERIGWIFPVQSLESKDHDYSDNVYFLKYAFVAFNKLIINDCDLPANSPESINGEKLKLNKFYDENCVVLILSNKQIEKINDFNIHYYLPFLYKQGFCLITKENFDTPLPPHKGFDYFEDLDRRINIRRISSKLESSEFLVLLFTDLLKYQQNNLVIFHFLYQVIELLMGKVFEFSIHVLINKIDSEDVDLYKAKDDLGDILNEKKKLQQLFNDFISGNDEEKKELLRNCNELLNFVYGFKLVDTVDAFYKVRNLIVHDYSAILQKGAEDLIVAINHSFEALIINIILDYNEPSATL